MIKRQSVFDRLGKESPPLEVAVKEPEQKTEVKALKPLKTSITVQLKVSELLCFFTNKPALSLRIIVSNFIHRLIANLSRDLAEQGYCTT